MMNWIGSLVLLSLVALAGCLEISQPNAGGCGMSFTKKSCLDADGCYWCASTTYASQRSVCVDEVQALHFPTWVYTCSHKAAPALEEELVVEPPQTGCDNPRTEDECLTNPDCVWCSSGFGPAQEHCMSAEQAKYIPAGIVTCKSKKDDEPAQQLQATFNKGVDPQPGAGCTNFMEKKACLQSSACHWCENKFNPSVGARCVDDTEAQFLPDMFFKCKKGKDPKPAPGPEPTDDDSAVVNDAKPEPAPGPAPTCKDAKDKKACKHIADCAWCVNQFNTNGSVCLDASAAAFIPETEFKCKASKKSPAALSAVAPSTDPCKDAVDAAACKDTTGCSWCENKFNPAMPQCMNTAAAAFMPPTVFKCKAAKKKTTVAAIVEVTPAADPCADAMDKASCKDVAGCAWCESLFNPMGSRCMDADKAQFIPASVFKCKASKKAPSLSAEPEPTPTPTPTPTPCKSAVDADSCQAIDGCAWCENLIKIFKSKCVSASKAQFLPPAIFTCTSSAPTVAALKQPAPAPAPTPAADPCKDAMDKKSCKVIDGCAWCVNQFNPTLGSLCMDAAHSAFIPPTVFKCKAAKKQDDSLEAALSADPTPGPQPGMMCGNTMDKKGCLNNAGCFWCTNSFGPSTFASGHCYNEMEAKYLPAYMYKCKAAKVADSIEAVDPTPGPQPGMMCGNSMDKKGCLKNPGCFWCTNSFGPSTFAVGHCYNEMEAKFLPAYMYKCKAAKQQEVFEEGEDKSVFQAVKDLFSVFSLKSGDAPSPYAPPTPGAGCTSAMDKDSCLDQKDCYWCDNKFTPGTGARCMDATSAKFLPDIVFKCKKGKHKKDSPSRKISF